MQKLCRSLTRRIFLGMQASAIVALLTSCSSAGEGDQQGSDEIAGTSRSLEEIRSSGYLNVGILTDVSPFAYLNTNGRYSGFDQYFCLYLTDETGLEVNYVPVDPRDRYEVLKSNKIDMCLAQMSPSDDLSEGIEYTGPLYALQLGMASRASNPVTSVEQLTQGELVVCEGSYAQQYAAEAWPDVSVRAYKTFTDALIAFETGVGIALLADELSLASWSKGRIDLVLGMKGIGEPRTISPAIVAGQAELYDELREFVRTYHTRGYAERAYNIYIAPAVDDDYTFILDAVE